MPWKPINNSHSASNRHWRWFYGWFMGLPWYLPWYLPWFTMVYHGLPHSPVALSRTSPTNCACRTARTLLPSDPVAWRANNPPPAWNHCAWRKVNNPGKNWDNNGIILGYWWIYSLVNIQNAIENGHRNSGFTRLENGGSFHSYVSLPEGNNHQQR